MQRILFVLIGLLSTYNCLQFIGVNQAVAEFGANVPGTFGTDYTYPSTSSIDYFVAKGMNIFRVPFLWERMQTTLNGPLNTGELGHLDTIVNYITSTKGVYCLIDPHNYARYNGQIIGTGVAVSAFTDFWTKLATHYKGNSKVVFGIMNEPHDMVTENWRDAANAAIVAIRSTGATNLITVPGNAWTGAWTWTSNSYGTPNSVAMASITDSGNNFIYEVHQYLDDNGSGTTSTCVSTTIGSQRLQAFTAWARSNGRKALLGEFAGANNPTCVAAVTDMLNYIKNNQDVWVGWTWWAAGPWWGSYMFSLEPGAGNSDQPLMGTLQSFVQLTPIVTNAVPTSNAVAPTTVKTTAPQTSQGQPTSAQQTAVSPPTTNPINPSFIIDYNNIQSSSGMASTTKVAIGVGVTFGFLAVILAVVITLLVLRRRRGGGITRGGSSTSLVRNESTTGMGISSSNLHRTDSDGIVNVPIQTHTPPPVRPLPAPVTHFPAPVRTQPFVPTPPSHPRPLPRPQAQASPLPRPPAQPSPPVPAQRPLQRPPVPNKPLPRFQPIQ